MEDVTRLIHNLACIEYGINRRAVAQLISIGPPAVPHLCRALEGENPVVRTWAAEALGKIGDARSIGSLCRALKDRDTNVRVWAVRALVTIGEPAVPHLRGVLNDGCGDLRGRAAHVLGEIRHGSAVPPLCRRLRDPELEVRRRAAEALGKIAAAPAVVPLCRALEDEDWGVRKRAAFALGRIAQEEPVRELRAALPLLYRYRGAWSFETPDAKRVYRVAAERIHEATAWVQDLPLPGQPPAPAGDNLPLPVSSPVLDPEHLPLPGDSVELAGYGEAGVELQLAPHGSGLVHNLRRFTETMLTLSSVPFS